MNKFFEVTEIVFEWIREFFIGDRHDVFEFWNNFRRKVKYETLLIATDQKKECIQLKLFAIDRFSFDGMSDLC